MEETTQQMQNV